MNNLLRCNRTVWNLCIFVCDMTAMSEVQIKHVSHVHAEWCKKSRFSVSHYLSLFSKIEIVEHMSPPAKTYIHIYAVSVRSRQRGRCFFSTNVALLVANWLKKKKNKLCDIVQHCPWCSVSQRMWYTGSICFDFCNWQKCFLLIKILIVNQVLSSNILEFLSKIFTCFKIAHIPIYFIQL